MHQAITDRVHAAFTARFGDAPRWLVRAPGRVNLIGEHTDYNDGFVLPLAIDRAVTIALRPRPDERVLLHSLDFPGQPADFALDEVRRADPSPAGEGWVEYVKGVAWALHEAAYALSGWEGVLAGDVPVGAGLSSSAALELAVARAFAAVGGWPWAAPAMALAGQRAENAWVGVNCGIMDQMISAAGVAGHALLIDCRTLESAPAPLPPGAVLVILDTNTRRGLVDSAYNERRAQCEMAAAYFGVPALRDVSPEQFALYGAGLDPVTRRRARHIVGENERVLQAVTAMRAGDAAALGALMDASHASLRDDFEVSSPALDAMAACAREQVGVYGARMTGAGFGGCAVALVDGAQADGFAAAVRACYVAKMGVEPAITITEASAGASCAEL